MISLVIQAGGRSSRMGTDKGLVQLGDRLMIEHVLAATAGLADEQLITTNNPAGYAHLGVPMTGDEQPGAGALPGLRTALGAARGELVLLVACDMPFLQRPVLQKLLDLADEQDVVVPRWDGQLQTLHAVYRRQTCLSAVDAALAAGQKRMISFYDQVRVREVGAEELAGLGDLSLTFFNANTPEELDQAEKMLAALE